MPPSSIEAERSQQLDVTELEIDNFFANSPQSEPAPNFNPFVVNFIDEELLRPPTGSTIPDPNSVLGESGRLYHG